jgi:hypothetical protein
MINIIKSESSDKDRTIHVLNYNFQSKLLKSEYKSHGMILIYRLHLTAIIFPVRHMIIE